MADYWNDVLNMVGQGKTKKAPKGEAVPVDPRYSRLVKSTTANARDYRATLPNVRQQQYNLAGDTTKYNLARDYKTADQGANRRGLFYGGMRAGARADAEGINAADLGEKIRGINVQTENNALDLENAAIESAFGLQEVQQGTYDDAYNEALSRRAKEMATNGGLVNAGGKALGGVIGGYAGQKDDGAKKK